MYSRYIKSQKFCNFIVQKISMSEILFSLKYLVSKILRSIDKFQQSISAVFETFTQSKVQFEVKRVFPKELNYKHSVSKTKHC